MVAEGTIDEHISALIAAKRTLVDAVTDGIETDAGEASMLGDLLYGLAVDTAA